MADSAVWLRLPRERHEIWDFDSWLWQQPSKRNFNDKYRIFWIGGMWRTAQGAWNYIQQGRIKRHDPHASRNQLRLQVFDLLGRHCVKCGFEDERALQIDHINGGGVAHRRSYRSPDAYYKSILEVNGAGFQVLCANCNWIKRHENKELHKYLLRR